MSCETARTYFYSLAFSGLFWAEGGLLAGFDLFQKINVTTYDVVRDTDNEMGAGVEERPGKPELLFKVAVAPHDLACHVPGLAR